MSYNKQLLTGDDADADDLAKIFLTIFYFNLVGFLVIINIE